MAGHITFEFAERPAIKGFPELRWTGKRPYRSTQYFPAQLRERYGEEHEGWINKIYWGDNLQVMSHLLKEFRGKVDLVYIDPPFDSKADYKMKIKARGQGAASGSTSYEEKQYSDVWTNDEYLQFMYERLILMRELISDTGSIYLHCDWRKTAYLRLIMDEVFGASNFRNEIVWGYRTGGVSKNMFARKHDTILFYSKTGNYIFNTQYYRSYQEKKYNFNKKYPELWDEKKQKWYHNSVCRDVWEDINVLGTERDGSERTDYPTQKPEALISRIINASTDPGGLVFDCFMGSGTTQAVAMKLGRRFIGADINLGAVQTATRRLISLSAEADLRTSFEVYSVNNYEFFRNPIEARDLLIEALGIKPLSQREIWDGELEGRMVKIMPVNRVATKADLEELKANLPYKVYEKRKEEHPDRPVERITIICMGHEPDLKASLEQALSDYSLDIEILDILRDKPDLQLKCDSEADIAIEGNRLVIRAFYPLNLMQKLSLRKDCYVEDWRQLVESVMIDWNYDGEVMQPAEMDVPGKKGIVKGIYDIPADAGTIRVKITDLLSESLEVTPNTLLKLQA
jgi:DNA modification methylase